MEGCELLPLYVPHSFEANGAVLTHLLDDLQLDPKRFESRRPSRRFRDLCQSLGLRSPDTVTALRRVPNKDKRPLFRSMKRGMGTASPLTERGLRLLLRPLLPSLEETLRAK
jgi:hypothetical protein